MKITQIDHIVLTVKNINDTIDFYTTVLGMTVQTYADNRVALTFGQQKINLHQQGHEFSPKAKQTTSGAADLCFISETELGVIERPLPFKQQFSIQISQLFYSQGTILN